MPGSVDRPFRRMTDPVLVPVGATASSVPVSGIPVSADTFYVVNSNACWVRLRGTLPGSPSATPAIEGKGWLFPPGFAGVFSTQSPSFMSAIAVERPGYPLAGLTFSPLEVSYGSGS